MKKFSFVLAGMAALATVGAAGAQAPVPFSVEVRADAAIPTGDFADGVDAGPGFAVTAAVGISRGLALYGGYSRTAFERQDVEGELVDQGLSVGLTTGIRAGRIGVQPYFGAGLLIHDLKSDGGPNFESDVGFEVGGGFAIPLGQRVRLTPGLGYRRYATEVPILLVGKRNVEYFTAGVGLNISL